MDHAVGLDDCFQVADRSSNDQAVEYLVRTAHEVEGSRYQGLRDTQTIQGSTQQVEQTLIEHKCEVYALHDALESE